MEAEAKLVIYSHWEGTASPSTAAGDLPDKEANEAACHSVRHLDGNNHLIGSVPHLTEVSSESTTVKEADSLTAFLCVKQASIRTQRFYSQKV